jgi:hypothetical protein
VTRRWLMMLICAVGNARYFESWRAAVQLRVALGRAERLANLVSDKSSLNASRLSTVRSIATPMLALAPTPGRSKLCQIRASEADADCSAWEHAERQWQRSVSQILFYPAMHIAQHTN